VPDLRIEAVDWNDDRAVGLRRAMDAETGAMYQRFIAGQTPEVTTQIGAALTVDPSAITKTMLALDGEDAVGHAALRPFGDALEVKKVFTDPASRGRGVAKALLARLEGHARDLGVRELVLQTGSLQVEAIGLYEAIGYRHIPPFGAYVVIPGAVCMSKSLEA
jgi:GNAT superfamily N-acetyltransferase